MNHPSNDLEEPAGDLPPEDPDRLCWFTASCGRIELQIRYRDACGGSHQGRCDDDVAALARVPYLAEQLARIDPADLRRELREYGAWDAEELADHAQNLHRLLWCACSDIREDPRTE